MYAKIDSSSCSQCILFNGTCVRYISVPVAGVFNASTACYFKFPDDLTESSQVINASLGVYLRATDHSDRSSSSSSLRLLVRKNVRSSAPIIYRRKRIQGSGSSRGIGGRWHTIDVKSLVQSWISEPNGNVGVTIGTSDAHGQHPTVIVQPRNAQEETLVSQSVVLCQWQMSGGQSKCG